LTDDEKTAVSPSRPRFCLLVAAVLVLTTPLGCGTRKGDGLPPIVREIVHFDLYERFDEAILEARNPQAPPHPGSLFVGAKRVHLAIGGERPALLLPPPATMVYELDLPDRPCVFRFALGLSPAPGRSEAAVRFQVLIDGKVAFEKVLGHGKDGLPVDWHDAAVDLTPYRRRRVRLTLSTSPANEDLPGPVAAGFATPRIVTEEALPRLEEASGRPNVLVVLVDTLRADHLSCYGYSRPTSPCLDALARESALYERVISQAPWTWPATASIFTSLYPNAHGVVSADRCYLRESIVTLAELFQDAGYTTWGISANSLICRAQNFHQGFEIFHELFHEPADRITDEFLGWLPEASNRVFFAYLHYLDPHHPYDPPEAARRAIAPELFGPDATETLRRIETGKGGRAIQALERDKEHVIALYDGEIRHWDTQFGRIVEALRSRGLLDKTVIVVTSDHGEELWEHGHLGHAKTLYQEVLHVPLVLHARGMVRPGRIASLAETTDILPTLCALAAVDGPPGISGRVLPGVKDASSPPARDRAFASTSLAWRGAAGRRLIDQEAILTGSMKLIRSQVDEGSDDRRYELFDLAEDPGEHSELSAAERGELLGMRTELERWIAEHPLDRTVPRTLLSEALRGRLRALGYLADDEQPSDGVKSDG